MSETKITRIVLRNDTTSNWTAVGETVVLLKGEIGIEFLESGSAKIKIGNGKSAWNYLPYVISGGTTSDGDADNTIDSNELIEIRNRIANLENSITSLQEVDANFNAQVTELTERLTILEEAIGTPDESLTAAVEELDSRTSVIEDSMDRVDYLISSLTDGTTENLDIAAEI